MEYLSFDYKYENAGAMLCKALEKQIKTPVESLVLAFIGSDANIGDSLAPLCGSLFKGDFGRVFTYGSLDLPITAKEVPYFASFLQKTHPLSTVIAIDAAIGKSEDVGLIKVQSCGIKPGLGVDKDLPKIGDFSIIGILGEKNGGKSRLTGRFSVVYNMANVICCGLEKFLQNNENRLKNTL